MHGKQAFGRRTGCVMSDATPVRVAVVGAGVIGRTLATRWREAGYPVTLGVREPGRADIAEFAGTIGTTTAAIPDAVAGSDAVLLAVSGSAVDEVLAATPQLDGRIVIDATNDVRGRRLNHVEAIAAAAPHAHVYRAFNSVGWENFADPDYGGTAGDLIYCGPDGDARPVVEGLIAATGLRPVRVGDNDAVEIVDAMTRLWFALALQQGWGRGVGFKVLTRD